jgi:HTH-type transcriptional repressor of NAD biosynthesis genes
MIERFRHGLVIGKFYPPHAGHRFLIRAAADSCEQVTVVVMAADVESIPLGCRVDWLREDYRDRPEVTVCGIVDNLVTDFESPAVWDGHVALMRAAVEAAYPGGAAVDAVFTSEPYGAELARRFGAADVRLDGERATFAVSGTKVRADPIAHWDLLEPPVRAWFAKRVVVLGAESTGTTTLSRDLAAALRARGGPHALTGWVPEYGRELTVVKLAVARARAGAAGHREPTVFDLEWSDGDFAAVAERQAADEQRIARSGGPVLVCDTDPLATVVWQERYLGASTAEVRDRVARLPPRAVYLLTHHEGVPFTDDGLRDGEHLRPWMTDRFRAVLAEGDVPWIEVHGDRSARLTQALGAVDALLAEGWQLAHPLE